MYPAGLHFVLGVSTGLAQYFIWMVYTLVMYWPPRAKRRLIITLTLLLKDTTSQRCYLLYCIILQVYVCNVYCVTYHCALQVHQSVAIHNRGRSRERLEIDDENRSIRHEILPVEVPGSIQIGTARETKAAPIEFTTVAPGAPTPHAGRNSLSWSILKEGAPTTMLPIDLYSLGNMVP